MTAQARAAQAYGLVEDVRKIAVLAPNAVGDFVFTLPALHALQRAYPQAELALVGQPWHRDLLQGRPGPVSRVLPAPRVPGVGIPVDAAHDPALVDAFLSEMRRERFDLAVQMFGGGRYSNPFVTAFGARLAVGARADDAPPLDRWVRYAVPNNRRLALLEVAALAGAGPAPLAAELEVTPADRREAAAALAAALASSQPAPEVATADRLGPPAALAAALPAAQPAPEVATANRLESPAAPAAALPAAQPESALAAADRSEAAPVQAACGGRPLAVLQPGSSDPRRCWPAASFAAVGDALAAEGAVVAINGTAAEAPLVRAVIGQMRRPAIDLSGQLSLAGLCGLLDGATLMVSNDTGPLHLALAIGTPAVGIFWFTNLVDGTPLRQHLLHVALSLRLHCPQCGAQNVRYRCPHDPSFVDDVPAGQVAGMATALLRASDGTHRSE